MGNMDPTQFMCIGDDENLKMLILKDDDDVKEARAVRPNDTALFIKAIPTIFADGSACPMVFSMAAPSLEPEDMLVLRVPGLTDSTEPSAFGYLLVTRTRAGNRRSASWIAMHVILPFIESLRNAVSESMSDEDESRSRAMHDRASIDSKCAKAAPTSQSLSPQSGHHHKTHRRKET